MRGMPPALQHLVMLNISADWCNLASTLQSVIDCLPEGLEDIHLSRLDPMMKEVVSSKKPLDVSRLQQLKTLRLDGFGYDAHTEVVSSHPISFTASPTLNPVLNDIIRGVLVEEKQLQEVSPDRLDKLATELLETDKAINIEAKENVERSIVELRKTDGLWSMIPESICYELNGFSNMYKFKKRAD